METVKSGVQKVVNEIYQEFGEVRPSILIEKAKPKNSPAHDAFEWDDKVAGNEFRLIQARYWIRRVEIIIDDRPERLVHVPLLRVEGEVNESDENYYKPISVVGQNVDEYQRALSETLARLNSTRAAYNELKSVAEKKGVAKVKKIKRADKGFDMIERALTA